MTMKTKRRLKSLLKYLVLACFLVLTMFPFVWMLLTSLKGSQGEIYAFPVRYLPNPASAVNYVAMLWKGNFGRYMLNSFFSSAVAATCAVFIAILASYVISRFHFRFKNVLLLFFLVTQMIPMFIMLAPLYLSLIHICSVVRGSRLLLWGGRPCLREVRCSERCPVSFPLFPPEVRFRRCARFCQHEFFHAVLFL